MGNLTVNVEGLIALCGFCLLILAFPSPNDRVSSSGICFLVRRNGLRKYGRRVQHRVRKSREKVKMRATVERTVGKIIVSLCFPEDWLVDAIATSVGMLVTVVGAVLGNSEGRVVGIEDDEMVELGPTTEVSARIKGDIEGNVDGMDNEGSDVLAVSINPCDPEDGDNVDTTVEVESRVGKMEIPEIVTCGAGAISEGCWAKGLGGTKALGVARVLVVRSYFEAEGSSWPSFFGILCAGGPGIPPAACIG
jgi:hypothetical protein